MRPRRGSILVETMIAIMMLALAVPVTVSWMQDAAADRADAVNSLRATAMATAIAENIIADSASASAGLGMTALGDPTAYLDAPVTGLKARLKTPLAGYTNLEFTYSVAIGALVGPKGIATADASLDVVRPVTITVQFPGARGKSLSLAISLMVTDPK